MSEKATFANLISVGQLELGDGYRTKRAEHGRPGLPILRVAEVLDGRIDPKFEDYVSESYRASMGQKTSRPGDVVLTTKGTVGRVAVIPEDGPEFVYSPQVCFFRTNPGGLLTNHYLYYWFRSEFFWSQARSLKGQTDMADYINLADIRSLQMIVPPIAQQNGITEVLGALDEKITINDRIITKYEQILRLEFEALEIDVEPEPRDFIPTSYLIEFNPSLRTPSGVDAVYLDMAALPTTTARVSTWTRRPPKSGTRFMNGDTVMARITPCLENGKTSYIDFLEENEVGVGSTEFIVMRSRAPYPTHLSYFLARSPRFRDHAIRNMVGSSGRQRVSAASLTDFPLMRPDKSKLAKFGETTSMAFAHLKAVGAESKTLAELRDSLLPKLMSGEIRVRDAEKAVEETV